MKKIEEIDCIVIEDVFYDKKKILELLKDNEDLLRENIKLKETIEAYKICFEVHNKRKGR